MNQQEQGGNHGEDKVGSMLKTKGAAAALAMSEGRFTGPEFNFRSPGPEAGTAPKRPGPRLSLWNRLHAGKKRNKTSNNKKTATGGKYKTRRARKVRKH